VQHDSQAGVGLVEVVMAILVLGGAIAALLAGITTAVAASDTHRDLVRTDTVMRNYAEATKQAVREQCAGTTGGTFSVAYSATDFTFSTTSPTGANCPNAAETATLTLEVTGPAGTKSMQIMVRRP
jgi:type II secretory pathway pseudopilin PulG